MARDFAAVNLAIWQDPDWRELPADAKILYLTLWTHPQLSRAGVVDWRPGRLAALIDSTWTASHVRAVADTLEARLFIVTDEQTEECLIRSWVRFDGLMKSPVMAVTFANEYAAVVSTPIREVIVHELHKLRDKEPTLAAWSKDRVLEVLDMPSLDPRSRDLPTDALTRALTPTLTPAGTVMGGDGANPAANHPSTPAPAPTPITPAPSRSRRKPEHSLPDGWAPNDNHREQARAERIDLVKETAAFKDHALANDRRLRDWDAGFRMWLGKAKSFGGRPQPVANTDWMAGT